MQQLSIVIEKQRYTCNTVLAEPKPIDYSFQYGQIRSELHEQSNKAKTVGAEFELT